ncbi:tryptophan synthase subunit alpha [Sphingomonas piscis]|uniref:Tryptophan synthase alpha chain n=1 Tax=Sphingomonas piscis TaxID=2714943 RepID=A0A6G7YNP6_9SPHN|nr:tryptophan synthase subunit alpha [Sphingomonas piscis]QIK78346.1 tryptophan synthase subunit alpha [Sphingomonas piscis]
MSRYDQLFAGRNEGVFGGFLMLGDPDLETSARLLDAIVEGGADMIEVGIPFSDPVADGPVIQAAAKRALAQGVTVEDCFQLIAGFRRRHPHVPVGILTYANLVLSPGRQEFFRRAAQAGADSLLVADLPAREAEPWASEMVDVGLDPVLIAAANTPKKTLREIARLGRGYTYVVTRVGITGTHAAGSFDGRLLDDLREVGAPPPVFGFGISQPEHVVAAIQAGAAGVISGSAIVACLDQPDPAAAVRDLVARLKSGTRNDSAPS